MASIRVNGRTINLGEGGNYREIHINGNGSFSVDGVSFTDVNIFSDDNPTLVIEGFVANIKMERGSVKCGNVSGDIKASGSVTCGDVAQSVDASGSVTCNNINGDARAGGSINARGHLKGSIRAGGSVNIG
jgi:hypothetical protein